MQLATFSMQFLYLIQPGTKMTSQTTLPGSNPLGFHYFDDTVHYSNQDLETWLPELERLSASWVILLSDSSRAIPEQFIAGLIDAGITPIIHFRLQLPDAPSAEELKPLLTAYQRWGVKLVVFFDKPNDSSSWSSAGWSHQDLVERFMDRFLPLALEALRLGLTPVFPPLMPGGSYWDTSFFKSSIQSLQRRGQQAVLENMATGAYAYTFGHELSWGEGGPEKWPQSRPYLTPAGAQDQRGFNNFIWLRQIASSLGVEEMPVILFGAGIKQPDSYYSPEVHAEIVQSTLARVKTTDPSNETNAVLACNFWLLSADQDSDTVSQAWIKPDGEVLPAVRVLASGGKSTKPTHQPAAQPEPRVSKVEQSPAAGEHPIEHYLLLPVYEWGIADWHLEVARPFILKYQPTIGFSIKEAALAKKVTVIGGDKTFSDEDINRLRSSGCVVDQITGDGTSIATQLLER